MSEENVARARELFATIRVLQRRLFHWYAERAGSTSRPPLCVDLSLPQFNTLNVILEHGTVTIKELAEALHVSAPSASAMVDRLVEMGLAVREQGQEDRREVHVQLSETGAENLRWHEEQFLLALAELLDKVGPDCAKQWCKVYSRVRAVLLESPETKAVQETVK